MPGSYWSTQAIIPLVVSSWPSLAGCAYGFLSDLRQLQGAMEVLTEHNLQHHATECALGDRS